MFHLATECTPPKVQFVPYIPMLKENNVRTGFVETGPRIRPEKACAGIGLWMLAILEVGCTYGWRHASVLKMRKQVDPNANVIRLEPGMTKNKKGLEITLPRRVRELLLQCIQGKQPDDYLFSRANGKPVKDFRGSWERVCNETDLPGLQFHDLRRTAARNMRRGHVSEKVAMEVEGWQTTSVFHRYAIVDNQDVADAMDMLERSQDEQRQRFEDMLRTAVERSGTTVDSAPSDTERSTSSAPITSRLHHVRGVETPTLRLHRGTKKAAKREHHKTLGVVPGGGVEPPRYQVPADFESAASASSAIPAIGRT